MPPRYKIVVSETCPHCISLLKDLNLKKDGRYPKYIKNGKVEVTNQRDPRVHAFPSMIDNATGQVHVGGPPILNELKRAR